jgi:hypothetical protein
MGISSSKGMKKRYAHRISDMIELETQEYFQ